MPGPESESGPEAPTVSDPPGLMESLAPTMGAALVLLTVPLAFGAQFLLQTLVIGNPAYGPQQLLLPIAFYMFAVACLLALASLRPRGSSEPLWHTVLGPPWREAGSGWKATIGRPREPRRNPLRAVLWVVLTAPFRSALVAVAFGLSLAIIAVLQYRADGNIYYYDLVVLWLVSIACYLAALIPSPSVLRASRMRAQMVRHKQALYDSGLLLLAAVALRVPYLGDWPGVINGDEGIVGTMARGLPAGGNLFGTDFAYGSLYYLIRSPFVFAFDGGIAGLRVVDAFGGALAAPALYLAGRQLFGRRVGLIAGVLMASAHMHIHLSRIALGHAVDATLTAAVIFLFMRGLQKRDAKWMALAGVGLGLSQYGYVGGRLLGLTFAAYVLFVALLQPGYFLRVWKPIAVSLGAALITALPMVRWALVRPEDYFARVQGVGFVQSGGLHWQVEETGLPVWQVMLNQARDGFLSIIAYPASAFYEAHIPMLNIVIGALFVLGFAFSLWRIRDRRMLLLATAVLGGLGVLMLGQNATIAAYRITGVLPVFVLLASAMLILLAEGVVSGLGYPRQIPSVILAVVVAMLAVYDISYYFGRHLPECRYTDRNTSSVSVAADYIGHLPDDTTVLTLTEPLLHMGVYPSVLYLADRSVVDISLDRPDVPRPGESGGEDYIYTIPPHIADLKSLVENSERAVVLAVPERAGEITLLHAELPGGQRTSLRWCGEVVFEVYQLSPATDSG